MTRIKKMELSELKELAKEVRKEILHLIYRAKTPHIGSCFSSVEIMVALYFDFLSITPENKSHQKRDRFILSKGHACAALYVTLAKKGMLPQDTLAGFAANGGTLECHPTRNTDYGIDLSTGSLGHGLSIGAGMALAEQINGTNSRIAVLMSDGELNEGTNWESIMFAAHHKLDNLIGIVDCNQIQALGETKDIINLCPIEKKWEAFGWAVRKINGHSMEDLITTLHNIPFEKNKPSCIIAETKKGKGVSFMEHNVLWHYRCPDESEFCKAVNELENP